LRDRASDRERFFITAYYDGRVTGNQEKAQQTCETWGRAYPRDMVPHAFLSGFIHIVTGKYAESVQQAQKAIQLAPDSTVGYLNLGESYLYLGGLEEAEAALRRASERKLEVPYFLLLRYDIAFLKADKAGMDREVASAQGNSGAEDWISDREAFVLANAGRLQEARVMARHAVV